MTDIYVYYRVYDGTRGLACAAVTRLFAALQKTVHVTGALSQRADDPLTWMESYLQVDDYSAFEAALANALTTSGLSPYVNGERNVERFVVCA